MVLRTGEARFPQTDYKTSNHCVAYLDILGGTSKILNDKNNDFLNLINMLYCDVIQEAEFIKAFDKKEIYVKIFSDNILLAVEIEKNDEKRELKIKKMLNLVANIVNEMLRYGCLMRGAIVEGEFFHNDLFVYGKAHVEVVKTEENLAIYPRIIVKKEIQEMFPQCCEEAADGLCFLNNYIFAQTFENVTFKSVFLDLLKENKKDTKVKQKIMWAISYFNKHNADFIKMGSIMCQIITDEEIADAIK